MPRKTRTPLATDHLPSFEELVNAGVVDETGVVQHADRAEPDVFVQPSPDEGWAEPALEPDEIIPPARHDPAPQPEPIGIIYESRIRVLDAWQYQGSVPASAPEWIDRNWIGWADTDGLRGLPAGPCLRVPLVTGDLGVCRIGDYVARQEVLMMPDFPGDVRIEVWPQQQFEKLFIPTSQDHPHG